MLCKEKVLFPSSKNMCTSIVYIICAKFQMDGSKTVEGIYKTNLTFYSSHFLKNFGVWIGHTFVINDFSLPKNGRCTSTVCLKHLCQVLDCLLKSCGRTRLYKLDSLWLPFLENFEKLYLSLKRPKFSQKWYFPSLKGRCTSTVCFQHLSQVSDWLLKNCGRSWLYKLF